MSWSWHDPLKSTPSNAAGLRLSVPRLDSFYPDGHIDDDYRVGWGFRYEQWVEKLRVHMLKGDGRAAVVLSTEPLLIGAYSDELDAVLVLSFPDELADQYELKPGRKLVSSTMYWRQRRGPGDIVCGPGARGDFQNFQPLIADFLCEDADALRACRQRIGQAEWVRTVELSQQYMKRWGSYRDGRPCHSWCPPYREDMLDEETFNAIADEWDSVRVPEIMITDSARRFFIDWFEQDGLMGNNALAIFTHGILDSYRYDAVAPILHEIEAEERTVWLPLDLPMPVGTFTYSCWNLDGAVVDLDREKAQILVFPSRPPG